MQNIVINSVDNYQLSLTIFDVLNPKGYIQVIHGMQEHKERYINIALELNKAGYTVITSDMRGHGINCKDLGYFSNKNGDKLLLEDQKVITKYIMDTYSTGKVIILAHSMGTIITRNLIQTESHNYEKVILSGYPNYQAIMKFGLLLAKTIKSIKGDHYISKLVSDLSVDSFNKQIKNPRTSLDWLSYNEKNVDLYIDDNLCGFPFTISAFVDLFSLLCNMNKRPNEKANTNLPLLLLAGHNDPCVGGEKGIKDSINNLRKNDFTNITEITYENMRHEILNEKDSLIVINDIIKFLKDK